MFYAIKAPQDISFIKFREVYPHIVTRQIYKMRRNVQYIVVTRRNSLYVPDKLLRGKDITVLETTCGSFAAYICIDTCISIHVYR